MPVHSIADAQLGARLPMPAIAVLTLSMPVSAHSDAFDAASPADPLAGCHADVSP